MSVTINSFWILGLAVLLAAFSYHYWQAQQENRSLTEQLNNISFLRFFWVGLILVGIGLAGSSQRLWETAIWIIFTLISITNAVKLSR